MLYGGKGCRKKCYNARKVTEGEMLHGETLQGELLQGELSWGEKLYIPCIHKKVSCNKNRTGFKFYLLF